MKMKFHLSITILSFIIQLSISCKKETSCEGCKENNKPPIAIAGPDQVIALPTDSVLLDGRTSSDPDGTISEWLWRKISGPAFFIINNSSISNSVVKNLVKGIYQFELKVTDHGGLSAKDTVQIIVNDPLDPNRPPIANAGPDQTITLPTNSVTVNGTGSTDPDNNITNYTWTKISGPSSPSINSASGIQTQVTNLTEGVYEVELKVTDASGLFSKDTVRITVNPQASISLSCDSNPSHWTKFQYLSANEFFFAPRYWLNGDNFLMGIGKTVYAVSNKGRIWQYSNASDTWQLKGNFPENMSSAPLTFSVNGYGYCIGDGHCWQYDPALEGWTMKSNPMSTFNAPLVINDKVYMRDTSNHMQEYDPVFDHYSTKGICPVNLPLLGWFVINGNGYYVFENGQCWKYNAGNDSWQQKATLVLPGFLSNSSSFSLNNSGYILGDLNLQSYNNNLPMRVVKYNSILDKWTYCATEDDPGDGAYLISTISFNGAVYVGLGYNNGDFNAIDFWKFQ